MIHRENIDLAMGLELKIVSEKYSNHSIHNVNIIIRDELLCKDSAGLILSFLKHRSYSSLLSLMFISQGASDKETLAVFLEEIDRHISLSPLKYSLDNKNTIQLICVSGLDVSEIYPGKPGSGRMYRIWGSNFYFLNNIIAGKTNIAKGRQVSEVFKELDSKISSIGEKFSSIVRTWLYVENILGWYDKLNTARSEFFNKKITMDSIIPASTGIGAGNILNRDIVLSAIGIPESKYIKAEMLSSPLQCPALDYKSSFSRVVKITTPESHKLLISGTASIDMEGSTMFPNDVDKQIKRTFDVIEAILLTNGMSYSDVVRSIAYFPSRDYTVSFMKTCKLFGLECEYTAKVVGIVCRQDLRFEMEVDAVKSLQ